MSSFERLDAWPGKGRFAPSEEPGATAGFEADGAPEPPAPAADEPSLHECTQRAYREGLAAGRAEVPHAERDALRVAAEALEGAAVELLAFREGSLASQRREALELGVTIAETILRRALDGDARGLVARIELALERIADRGPLRLRLAPGDLELVRASADPDVAAVAEREAMELCADPALGPGEFRLEAGSQEADGRLDEMLRGVREVLADTAVDEEASS